MFSTNQIIVPLDVSDKKAVVNLLDKLPQVSFWKVGLEAFVALGPEIFSLLKDRQKKIFLDLKFHDIPNTIAGACKSASNHGVDLITIHAAAGQKAMEAAAKAIAYSSSTTKILAVTLLTSLNSKELSCDLKISVELEQYALHMALLAQKLGIDGAVCSPHEVSQIRQLCGENFILVCPGVRPSWSQVKDQKRIMQPKQALEAGADYLVIGRPITMADNPIEAWNRIINDITI